MTRPGLFVQHKLIASHLQIQTEVAFLFADKTSSSDLPEGSDIIDLLWMPLDVYRIIRVVVPLHSTEMDILNPV